MFVLVVFVEQIKETSFGSFGASALLLTALDCLERRLAPLCSLCYFSTLFFPGDVVNTLTLVGSVVAAAVIKIVALVFKRGNVILCFSRPALHHNLFAAEFWQAPTAELTTMVRERGLLVMKPFKLDDWLVVFDVFELLKMLVEVLGVFLLIVVIAFVVFVLVTMVIAMLPVSPWSLLWSFTCPSLPCSKPLSLYSWWWLSVLRALRGSLTLRWLSLGQ